MGVLVTYNQTLFFVKVFSVAILCLNFHTLIYGGIIVMEDLCLIELNLKKTFNKNIFRFLFDLT